MDPEPHGDSEEDRHLRGQDREIRCAGHDPGGAQRRQDRQQQEAEYIVEQGGADDHAADRRMKKVEIGKDAHRCRNRRDRHGDTDQKRLDEPRFARRQHGEPERHPECQRQQRAAQGDEERPQGTFGDLKGLELYARHQHQ